MKQLTTTSYAILGWLAHRDWTTYELAEQIKRNLRFFWQRAESVIYDEPKNLIAHGLAKAEISYVGKRQRTIYSITPEGRKVLQEWLGQPSAQPSLEFEALVRVFFGDFGTRDQLLMTLESVRALADEIQNAGTQVALEYMQDRAPFPHRVHISGLVFDFLWGYADHLRNWVDRSIQEVESWPDMTPEGKRDRAIELFRKALEEKDSKPSG
jgi:DNA-binding PadR family transcriptional regulator